MGKQVYVLGIAPYIRILNGLEFDNRKEASERAREENRYGEFKGRGVKIYKKEELDYEKNNNDLR